MRTRLLWQVLRPFGIDRCQDLFVLIYIRTFWPWYKVPILQKSANSHNISQLFRSSSPNNDSHDFRSKIPNFSIWCLKIILQVISHTFNQSQTYSRLRMAEIKFPNYFPNGLKTMFIYIRTNLSWNTSGPFCHDIHQDRLALIFIRMCLPWYLSGPFCLDIHYTSLLKWQLLCWSWKMTTKNGHDTWFYDLKLSDFQIIISLILYSMLSLIAHD